MERLAGIDAAFLYLETPSAHMHVTATIVVDPATMPEGASLERLAEFMTERVRALPAFRRRVVSAPLGLGHPFWIEEPGFDRDSHVRHAKASRKLRARRRSVRATASSASSSATRARNRLW